MGEIIINMIGCQEGMGPAGRDTAHLAFQISLDFSCQIIDSTTLQLAGTGRIAQLGEHSPYKAGVTGSIPVPPTINAVSSF